MEEKTIKASMLKAGDIVLTPGNFPKAWPFYLIMNPFTRGYNHLMAVYGENGRGKFLVIESISRCGPLISPLSKYFGEKVEVYRINHQLSDVFSRAILLAGDEILEKKYTFFDHFLLFPRAVMAYLGFSGRINNKYYPFYFCSEVAQVFFEEAPRFIEKALVELGKDVKNCDAIINIYKKSILSKFPRAKRQKDKIRLMAPYDFKELSFFEFICDGKLTD